VLVHDLHPDYLSTHYANERTARRRIGVQHHHAHVAAVMAEHGLDGPVLGFAYDGTGYGTDGSSWGGELLLADLAGYRRIATLRPIALPGGEQAIREVWRIALALLEDAFDGNPPLDRFASFDCVEDDRLALVRKILGEGVYSPSAHGLGRYFDGIGAIVLGRATAGYEGHVAMALEQACDLPAQARDSLAQACDGLAGGSYRYDIDTGSEPWQVDLRATVRGVVDDQLAGRAPGVIATCFHDTVVRFSTELVRMALERYGSMPIVLAGGCFQNVRLTEGLLAAFAGGPEVYRAERVPSNDGGLALGQVAVAAAVLEGRTSSCA
jgi:hydrogenase maturation protein HypF